MKLNSVRSIRCALRPAGQHGIKINLLLLNTRRSLAAEISAFDTVLDTTERMAGHFVNHVRGEEITSLLAQNAIIGRESPNDTPTLDESRCCTPVLYSFPQFVVLLPQLTGHDSIAGTRKIYSKKAGVRMKILYYTALL